MKSSKPIYSIPQHLSVTGEGRGEATHHSSGGGQELRKTKNLKWRKWVKGCEKCSL